MIEARISRRDRGTRLQRRNVRASVPRVALAGPYANANEVSKKLRLVREPAKQTNVTLRAGEREGDVERWSMVEEIRRKVSTLDNTR